MRVPAPAHPLRESFSVISRMAHCKRKTEKSAGVGPRRGRRRIGFVEVIAEDLLPLPRTCEALDIVAANVRAAQEALPVPLALEPIVVLSCRIRTKTPTT